MIRKQLGKFSSAKDGRQQAEIYTKVLRGLLIFAHAVYSAEIYNVF